ncbi:MAG: holo-[acyl-carrier-protein] synthase [Ignavibacteria bacterium RBG_13_36_8]|nr:MAG: holo-[acyl-carrier-protein] synthase [Ignavibacteria bacterium RBG_13_36_8]
MIFGIGTDVIEVKRVLDKISSEEGFKESIFTEKEIEYCESKWSRGQNYAARYAAKEAFFKALGTGWRNGMKYNEIEIVNDALGKPDIQLHGSTKKYLEENNIFEIHVSLSHVKDYAFATVVLESK